MNLSRLAFPTAHRRSFVSTVLLSHTWDKETLVELRKQAKARGLSTYVPSSSLFSAYRTHRDHSKGNKSTLIARIQEHEENSVTSTSAPGTFRNASSNVAPPKKISQAASPGIPLVVRPDSTSPNSDFLAIKLPDLSRRPPNPPVQIVSFVRFISGSIAPLISCNQSYPSSLSNSGVSLQPYVPDFWNSARSKPVVPLEPDLPKLHVVSGSPAHYVGGPTHNLEKHQEDSSPSTIIQADDPPVSKQVGFWADFSESLGLPRSFSVRRTLSEASNLAAQTGKDESQTRSRPLTDEERNGLYILLGIVGGSWLVGALVNRPTVAAVEHDAQSQH